MRPQLPALRRDAVPVLQADYDGGELAHYEPLIDARRLLQSLLRNWKLALAVMIASLGFGLLSILLSPDIYRATAKVEIGPEPDSPITPTGSRSSQAPQEVDRTLQTQAELLGTRDMARAVLERVANAGGGDARSARGLSPDDLQDNVSVQLPRNSRIISIAYDDSRPTFAAAVANAYALTLIDRNLQTRFNASTYAREFLQKQLGLAKGRLEQSERALIGYARSAGLLDASSGMDTNSPGIRSLTASNLVQMNTVYAQAQSNRIQAQQRWQQAQSTPLMSLPEVLGNSAIQQLTRQKAELQGKLEENRARYRDEHPVVQQAVANINELDRQIQGVAVSVRNSIRDQYLVASRQEGALAGSVGQLKGATLAEQDRSVRYNILKRETDTSRELYDGLLQRYKQVSAEAGITSNNIAIVDQASPPESPVSPDPKKNMSLAAIGGAMLAFLLVFVRERMDHSVSDPESMDRQMPVRLLAVIPLVGTEDGIGQAILDPSSRILEACHSLRTAIELDSERDVPFSLLITSSKSQEGKSTTALGLAHAFAAAGQRVLLVDGDLRRPNLHRLAGIANVRGFSSVLAGDATLEEAVNRSDIFDLDLLPAGPRPDSPAALLDPAKIREIIGAARPSYDQVIIDGPPTMGIADASRLAIAVDATIFIVRSHGTSAEEARFALGRLASDQVDVLGAVLTMFDTHGSRLGYYYSYSYGEPAQA